MNLGIRFIIRMIQGLPMAIRLVVTLSTPCSKEEYIGGSTRAVLWIWTETTGSEVFLLKQENPEGGGEKLISQALSDIWRTGDDHE